MATSYFLWRTNRHENHFNLDIHSRVSILSSTDHTRSQIGVAAPRTGPSQCLDAAAMAGGPELYEVVEVDELRLIDAKRSVRSALLSAEVAAKWKSLNKRVRVTNRVLYALAFPFIMAVFVLEPAAAGRIVAIPIVMMLPMQVFDTSSLRVDILACLLRSYEFWLFSFINTISSMALIKHVGDLRAAVVPTHWFGIQMIIWADARIQSRTLAAWSLLGMTYLIFMTTIVLFNLIPATHSFDVLSYKSKQRATTSGDFLVNSFMTLFILMLRTAYRKRALTAKQRDNPMLACFVSYRCCVKLRVVATGPTQKEITPVPHIRNTRVSSQKKQQPLRFVPFNQKFSSQDVLWPRIARLFPEVSDGQTPPLTWAHFVVYLCGFCGVTINGGLFLGVYYLQHIHFDFTIPATLGVVSSFFFFVAFISCCQRQLLIFIVTSFDFIFSSLQITFSHMCVADMLRYDVRALTVLSGAMWTHWVITMDAITPVMRRRLLWMGKLHIEAQLLVFSALIQLFVMLELMRWDIVHLAMREEKIITIYNHSFTFRSAPFLVARATTLLLWSSRTIWRLLTGPEGQLAMVQGNVQYYANPKALRQPGSNWRTRLRGRFSVRPAPLPAHMLASALAKAGRSTKRNSSVQLQPQEAVEQ